MGNIKSSYNTNPRGYINREEELLQKVTNLQKEVTELTEQSGGSLSKLGWAIYSDSEYNSGNKLAIAGGTTEDITIDGLGTTIRSYLPEGVDDFYDTTTNKITPAVVGDGYTFSLSFKGNSSSSNGSCTLAIDIGGSVGQIFKRNFRFPRGTSIIHDFYFTSQGYSLGTFVENGGTIQITSDTGNSQIFDIALQVHRTSTPQ